jgi:hypothetical protein
MYTHYKTLQTVSAKSNHEISGNIVRAHGIVQIRDRFHRSVADPRGTSTRSLDFCAWCKYGYSATHL